MDRFEIYFKNRPALRAVIVSVLILFALINIPAPTPYVKFAEVMALPVWKLVPVTVK